MKFKVTEVRYYEADSEALIEKFPREYEDFLRNNRFTEDRDWVMDCIDAGGLELVTFLDSEIFID